MPETEVQSAYDGLPRIAASSYLNTAPLIWSFLRGSRRHKVRLVTDAAPARCADLLASGEVDAALVPIIEYQRIPEVRVVPDVCVGSHSTVRSVVLVSKYDDLKNVRSVALDSSSRTSQALVKIIFLEFLDHEPNWESWLQNWRVELNAMTTAEFVAWMNAQFKKHAAAKVIPDDSCSFR